MKTFDKLIGKYREHSREWEADPRTLHEIERGVMRSVLEPRRSIIFGPAWAFAAALVIVLVSVVSWPGDEPALMADLFEPVSVESIFYMEDHVAIWLDTSTDIIQATEGDQQ